MALAAGVALLAAGCGGGGKEAETTTATTATAAGTSQQRAFPNFRIVYDTGTDYLDPGLSYTVQGWAAMWNVYLSLLGYKHVNGPGRTARRSCRLSPRTCRRSRPTERPTR